MMHTSLHCNHVCAAGAARHGVSVQVAAAMLFAALTALVACGCAGTRRPGWGAPRSQPAATAQQQPAAAESPYADPLVLPKSPSLTVPPDPAGSAAQQEVQAFLDRLPKSDPGAPGELAMRLSDEPARGADATQASPQRERPAMPVEPTATPVDPPPAVGDAPAATNAVTQIPATNADSAGVSASPLTLPAEAPKAPPKLEALTMNTSVDAEPATVLADDDAASRVSNVPVSTDAVRARTLDETIAHLRAEAAQRPDDLDARFKLRAMLLATGREQEAIDLAGADAGGGEALLDDAVRSLAAIRQAAESPAEVDAALAEVEALRAKLRRSAELAIPNIALCSKVSSFGVYEELPAGALMAGTVNKAVVYCEIRNFYSEPATDGRLRTALASRIELLTPAGQSVWQKEEPEIEDLSRQRREDFFLAKLVTLPASLPAGEYVLKVAITDRLAKKANEAVRPVKIHGPGAVSAQR